MTTYVSGSSLYNNKENFVASSVHKHILVYNCYRVLRGVLAVNMTLQINPYTPGEGMVPRYLAGREQLLEEAGDKQNDLMELFVHLGKVGQKIGSGAVIFIDEVQYLKDDEFEALMAAIHRCNQLGLPLVIFAAGLPKIAKIAGDIKSYAERLFKFVPVDKLEEEDAKLALTKPASKLGVSYEENALTEILRHTECYPYFLQEYGQQAWNFADKQTKTITLNSVNDAYAPFINALDESFFKVRHDRASEKELEFMRAMVKCGVLPCPTSQVAKIMGGSYNRVAPIRAQLIHKGFIYATDRGEISFTVPQFEQYLKRVYGI